MGKMKQLYMEIEDYYQGDIPEDLTIGQYLQKRRKENEEWEQYEKEAKSVERTENHQNDEKFYGNGSSCKEKSS